MHQCNEMHAVVMAKHGPTKSNCRFVQELEISYAALLRKAEQLPRVDRYITTAYADTLYRLIVQLIGSDWYCFFCGFLEPEQVTYDERCQLCGSRLPGRMAEQDHPSEPKEPTT